MSLTLPLSYTLFGRSATAATDRTVYELSSTTERYSYFTVRAAGPGIHGHRLKNPQTLPPTLPLWKKVGINLLTPDTCNLILRSLR